MKELLFHIKYYPIIVNLFILFAMVGYIFNFRGIALYFFIGQSFYYNRILWILSKHFKFCSWHRVLISSMTFTLFLEMLYNYGFKLNYYLYICSCILILSLLISTILYYKYGCFNKGTFKNTAKHRKMDRQRQLQ